MKTIDVVVNFLTEDGEQSPKPIEVLAFESRYDALYYLETEMVGKTENGAYWEKVFPGTKSLGLRMWLRPTRLKEERDL